MIKKEYKSDEIKEVLEKNFIYLMVDFYEVQVEFLSSLVKIFNDLDKAYIVLFVIKKIYGENYINIFSDTNLDRSLSKFIKKASKQQISNFKIIDISSELNLPKETVRRKISELNKYNFLIKKERKLIVDWTNNVFNKIFENQITISSKFLSKFSIFYNRTKFFGIEYSQIELKKIMKENFVLHFHFFLDFQLKWYRLWKEKLEDMDIVLIFMFCSLNNLYQIKRDRPEESKISHHKALKFQSKLINQKGLNVSSISELSGIPRPTVLRKIKFLLNKKLIIKDLNNLYSTFTDGNSYDNKIAFPKIPIVLEHISDYLATSFNTIR